VGQIPRSKVTPTVCDELPVLIKNAVKAYPVLSSAAKPMPAAAPKIKPSISESCRRWRAMRITPRIFENSSINPTTNILAKSRRRMKIGSSSEAASTPNIPP
jgi:hypothetical protein